jgi:pyruvate kinase
VTRDGKTARLLSSLRPETRVIAATPSARVAGLLTLYRGITPVITPVRALLEVEQMLIERRLVVAGAVVVFISVSPDMTGADANYLNVQRIG